MILTMQKGVEHICAQSLLKIRSHHHAMPAVLVDVIAGYRYCMFTMNGKAHAQNIQKTGHNIRPSPTSTGEWLAMLMSTVRSPHASATAISSGHDLL